MGMELDDVCRLAEKANDMTISIGVALSPTFASYLKKFCVRG